MRVKKRRRKRLKQLLADAATHESQWNAVEELESEVTYGIAHDMRRRGIKWVPAYDSDIE
jgi:hypothetical protein